MHRSSSLVSPPESDPVDADASSVLFAETYDSLRRLARRHLAHERNDHTLTPTALIHEAYLKLAPQDQASFNDRQHFLMVAAQAMRRILINWARDRSAQKRGGDCEPVTLLTRHARQPAFDANLLALDEALEALNEFDPRKRKVVELRYFAGLTAQEAADVLGISRSTLYREWATARAWLLKQLGGEP
jgi:RNA polymerase sigma factor (TIGR02999 family)